MHRSIVRTQGTEQNVTDHVPELNVYRNRYNCITASKVIFDHWNLQATVLRYPVLKGHHIYRLEGDCTEISRITR